MVRQQVYQNAINNVPDERKSHSSEVIITLTLTFTLTLTLTLTQVGKTSWEAGGDSRTSCCEEVPAVYGTRRPR